MLAESFVSDSVMAWLVFVALLLASGGAIAILARVLRRRLPAERRELIFLEPVSYGDSPRTRRSPRHAIRAHRTLVMTLHMALLALVLLPGLAALRSLGVAGLEVAILFVLPALLVAFHARRRNLPQ